MKCPDCKCFCSDFRDLCPKCRADLREYKKANGLVVKNPSLTVEQLAERESKRGFRRASGSVVLKSLKGSKKTVRKEETAVIEVDSQLNLQSLVEVNDSSIDTVNIATTIQPTASITTALSADGGVGAITEADLWHQQTYVPQLFDDLFMQLLRAEEQHDFEIDFHQLKKFEISEDIKILFDLSFQEIVEPERVRRMQRDIKITEKRTVTSENLLVHLESARKFLEAPISTLKNVRNAFREEENKSEPLFLAPLEARATAALWDVGIAITGGLALTLVRFMFNEKVGIFELFATPLLDFVPYIGLFLTLTTLFVWVLPFISREFFGRSIGMRAAGLKARTLGGTRMQTDNNIVFSILMPISSLLLGWLPMTTGKLAIHDHLSRMSLFAKPQ